MEVSFKRQMNQSFMTIRDQFAERETCELQMLANNEIPALLSVEPEILDGCVCYWYDITGYRSLADYLGRRQLDMEGLRLLLFGLEELYRQLGEYLLDEWPLLLKEEYIYLDFAGKGLAFTYVPGWREEPAQAFQELMGRLLQQLDHKDRQAVMVAYDVYQMSLQRELPLEEMLQEAMQKHLDEEEPKAEEAMGLPEISASRQGSREREAAGDFGRKRMEIPEGGGGSGFRERLSSLNFNRKEGFWSRGEKPKEAVYGGRGEKPKEAVYGGRGEKPKEPAYGGRAEKLKESAYREGRRQQSSSVYLAGQEEMEALTYGSGQDAVVVHPTELLSGTGGLQGRLCYLGQKDWEDLILGKGDFLIGKKRQEVDGYLPERSVSRIHARVEKDGEDYFLEDLNSTNGTFLNGERLEYRQKAKLAAGDRIRFGNVEYCFR